MKKLLLIVGLLGVVSQNVTGSESEYIKQPPVQLLEVGSAKGHVDNIPAGSVTFMFSKPLPVQSSGLLQRWFFVIPSDVVAGIDSLQTLVTTSKNKKPKIIIFYEPYKTSVKLFNQPSGKDMCDSYCFASIVHRAFYHVAKNERVDLKVLLDFLSDEQKTTIYNEKLMQLPLFGSLNLGDVFEPGMLSWLKIHQVKVVFASGLFGLLALFASYKNK